jgi:tetratricopeptide (TPR) repeat protein
LQPKIRARKSERGPQRQALNHAPQGSGSTFSSYNYPRSKATSNLIYLAGNPVPIQVEASRPLVASRQSGVRVDPPLPFAMNESDRDLGMTTPAAPSQTTEALLAQLTETGFRFIDGKDYGSAQLIFKKIVELDRRNLNARFVYAQLIDDGTHKKHAESRDLMLAILDEYPALFDNPTEGNLHLIRSTAERCSHVGPNTKAIELFRKLAPASNKPGDYFQLSEALTKGNFLDESISALEKAIAFDPATYDTDANRETLRLARSNIDQITANKNGRRKIGRYPETNDFLGDFQNLIKNHIAVNLGGENKFIGKNTRFFTMGSCFARNLSRCLNDGGYASHHMEIAEHINTTFANRVFVDWLANTDMDEATRRRIEELLPPDWSKERTLQIIAHSNAFILTLGVAPAFFSRATGDFVLPRPSALNSRALAEKYLYRTTSVQENVENVLHVIRYIRSVSPAVKIIVTVSPVPLQASFEYESAVQADCLSKSTMRLVAQEVVYNSNIADIFYWPSFEIFRWAGSHSSNYFGADDGAAWHVSEEKVAGTIQAFIEMFSSG